MTAPVKHTGKEVCTAISNWLRERHGIDMTPREIWDMSPTGELVHVHQMYQRARAAGYSA